MFHFVPKKNGSITNASLTIRDRILTYIKAYQAQTGYPPTLGEIGAAVGKSRSVVHYHVNAMIEAGIVERRGHSPRAIKVL